MEQGVELDMVIETDLYIDEFNKRFLEWVQSNGWQYGCIMKRVDKSNNKITIKVVKHSATEENLCE